MAFNFEAHFGIPTAQSTINNIKMPVCIKQTNETFVRLWNLLKKTKFGIFSLLEMT